MPRRDEKGFISSGFSLSFCWLGLQIRLPSFFIVFAPLWALLRATCRGDRVEMSIFRAGRWCSGLGALTGWTRPPAPDLRLAAEAAGRSGGRG